MRAPPRWPRPARPQQLGRRSSVISWEAPLLPARGTVAWRNGFFQCRGSRAFGRPSGPQGRTQPAKLEIPFGHAFDKRGVSLPKSAVRARPVGLRSATEGGAVLGPSDVGRREGALRDHHYRFATLQGRYAPAARSGHRTSSHQISRLTALDSIGSKHIGLVLRTC